MNDLAAESRQRWLDYAFLTREMHKFLLQNDLETFFQVMTERDKLQKAIAAIDTASFKSSPEGTELYKEIVQKNVLILNELRKRQNDSQKQAEISTAYDLISKGVGSQLDQKG